MLNPSGTWAAGNLLSHGGRHRTLLACAARRQAAAVPSPSARCARAAPARSPRAHRDATATPFAAPPPVGVSSPASPLCALPAATAAARRAQRPAVRSAAACGSMPLHIALPWDRACPGAAVAAYAETWPRRPGPINAAAIHGGVVRDGVRNAAGWHRPTIALAVSGRGTSGGSSTRGGRSGDACRPDAADAAGGSDSNSEAAGATAIAYPSHRSRRTPGTSSPVLSWLHIDPHDPPTNAERCWATPKRTARLRPIAQRFRPTASDRRGCRCAAHVLPGWPSSEPGRRTDSSVLGHAVCGTGGRPRAAGAGGPGRERARGVEQLQCWLEPRRKFTVSPLFCIIGGATRGRHWSTARGRRRTAAHRAGRRPTPFRASSAPACPRRPDGA